MMNNSDRHIYVPAPDRERVLDKGAKVCTVCGGIHYPGSGIFSRSKINFLGERPCIDEEIENQKTID